MRKKQLFIFFWVVVLGRCFGKTLEKWVDLAIGQKEISREARFLETFSFGSQPHRFDETLFFFGLLRG